MHQVQVILPRKNAQHVISVLRKKCRVQNIVRIAAGNDNLIILRVSEEELDNTVNILREQGIGSQMGCLDIIQLEEFSKLGEPNGQKPKAPPDSQVQKSWWERIFYDANLTL